MKNDKPFVLPEYTREAIDLLDLLQSAQNCRENLDSGAEQERLICKLSDMNDDARMMLKNGVASGDTTTIRAAAKCLAVSSSDLIRQVDDPKILAYLYIVIAAAHILGGFTRLTRSGERQIGIERQKRATDAASAKHRPSQNARRGAVVKAWQDLKKPTLAATHRKLVDDLHFKVSRTQIAADLKELGLRFRDPERGRMKAPEEVSSFCRNLLRTFHQCECAPVSRIDEIIQPLLTVRVSAGRT